jgi:hypothetical protein
MIKTLKEGMVSTIVEPLSNNFVKLQLVVNPFSFPLCKEYTRLHLVGSSLLASTFIS